MILSAVIIFLIVFVLGSYVLIRYSHSRNKKLFFKSGGYKSFVWLLGLAILAPIALNIVFPDEPLDLEFLKLHSDLVNDVEMYRFNGQFVRYYFFKSLRRNPS